MPKNNTALRDHCIVVGAYLSIVLLPLPVEEDPDEKRDEEHETKNEILLPPELVYQLVSGEQVRNLRGERDE